MINNIISLFYRLSTYSIYIFSIIALLFLVEPYVTKVFGFTGLPFLTPQAGAIDLAFFPSIFGKILSYFLTRSEALYLFTGIFTITVAFLVIVLYRKLVVKQTTES